MGLAPHFFPVNAPGPVFPCQPCWIFTRQELSESMHMRDSQGRGYAGVPKLINISW